MSHTKTFVDVALCLSGRSTDKEPTSITTVIDEYLVDKGKSRPISKRFNPSSLYHLCQVERATRIKTDNWSRDEGDAQLSRYGVMGTAIHEALQNNLLASIPGKLWGKWECTNCHTTSWGFRPKPCQDYVISSNEKTMISCEQKGSWHYDEMYFQYKDVNPDDERYWITGYCDGIWFDQDTGKWYALELKTKGLDVFDGVYRRKGKTEGVHQEVVKQTYRSLPFEDQIFQAQLYVPLIMDAVKKGLMPEPPGQLGGVIVLNICRDNCRDLHSYIPYDPTHLNSAVAVMKAIMNTENPHTLCRKCPKPTSTYAKRCWMAHECFPDHYENPEKNDY